MNATLLAAALLFGVPWPVAGAVALVMAQPIVGGSILALAAMVATRQAKADGGPGAEAVYLAAVAAELRGGASLRLALGTAAGAAPHLALGAVARSALAGASMGVVAAELRRRLPVTAPLVVPTVELAAESGGLAAAMFDRLALRAIDEANARRELRTASAQARLSAWVVGGLPVIALGFGAVTGRLDSLIAAGTIGLVIVVVGAGLLAMGLVVVAVLSRGAR